MVTSKIIINGIEIVDLSLYLIENNILILGDIHLGYEDTLKSKGFLVPKQQFKLTIKRINEIINHVKKNNHIDKINKIIINGDLKHEFGTIQRSEWKESLDLIDFLTERCEELIVIKGNHDKIIQPILDKREIIAKEYYLISQPSNNHNKNKKIKNKADRKILICHGDFIPKESENLDLIIIGHEHPAIKLKQYPRTETYKTFVKTKWNKSKNNNKELIIMPSFNLLSEGSNVLNNSFLSPFLNEGNNDMSNKFNRENKELFVVTEDEIFHFPDSRELEDIK